MCDTCFDERGVSNGCVPRGVLQRAGNPSRQVVTLAVHQALKRNGFAKNVRAVAGYAVVPSSRGRGTGGVPGPPAAVAHAWLEVDGRVLDVVSDGLALCEAARRAGIDYSDAPAMEEFFGREVLALGEYTPEARRRGGNGIFHLTPFARTFK